MLGQIVWREGTTELEIVSMEGLYLLRGGISPKGYFYGVRLGRLLRKFRRQGVRRMLVPRGFSDWGRCKKRGIQPVDPLPFLRSCSDELVILALKKRGYEPENCKVALRGTRVGRAMVEAADRLVPQVRDIAVTASVGGESLQNLLRQEWGLAVRPDGVDVDGAIRFDSGGRGEGGVVLSLFGGEANLGGLEENLENFPCFLETEPLPLLGALWESGKLERDKLEFYLT